MPIQGTALEQLQSIIQAQSVVAQADLDLASFMQLVVDTLHELTQAKGAVVELVDGDHMVYQCASKALAHSVGLRLPREHSLSGLCVKSAEVLRCDDTEVDDRVDRTACDRVGVRSMVCTPLFQSGVAIGVLKVMSDQVCGFGDNDVSALKLLAGALGAALGKQVAYDALQRAEAQLRDSEMRMRIILDRANDAVISADASGVVIRWNRAASRLFGWSAEQSIGQNIAELIVRPEQRKHLKEIIENYQHDDVWIASIARQEYDAINSDGNALTVEVSLSRNRFDNAWEYTAFVHDVTDRKQMENAMRNLAQTDGLTGLANRYRIMEALKNSVTRTRRQTDGLALFFMDLNGFKQINDQYGHDVGDKALQVFATRLLKCVRQTDLVGRLGGDEFVILADTIRSPDQARQIVEKIMDSLALPMEEHGIGLATSIGISLYRPPLDANEWLQQADVAMYRAKRQTGQGTRYAFFGEETRLAADAKPADA